MPEVCNLTHLGAQRDSGSAPDEEEAGEQELSALANPIVTARLKP